VVRRPTGSTVAPDHVMGGNRSFPIRRPPAASRSQGGRTLGYVSLRRPLL